MQKLNFSVFPPMLENLDSLQGELDAALKRTWMMLGGIALSSVVLVTYVLAISK